MIIKLRQQLTLHKRTRSNRVPAKRSRGYLTTYLRQRRLIRKSSALRAALGFIRWLFAKTWAQEDRSALRSVCFITGRGRGTTQRFIVARTKIKELAAESKLFGVQKSAW